MDAPALVNAATLNLVCRLGEEGSFPCFTGYEHMDIYPKWERGNFTLAIAKRLGGS